MNNEKIIMWITILLYPIMAILIILNINDYFLIDIIFGGFAIMGINILLTVINDKGNYY